MKIKLEIDESIKDEEIVIRCRELSPDVQKIQQAILMSSQKTNIAFFKGNTEYYLPLDSILFFETSDSGGLDAHTADDIYKVKNTLTQLEEMLPKNFIRVSKSTILNVNRIFSIEKHITSFSTVVFAKSHKMVYVSRNYYKNLKQRINERRS